VTLLPQPFGIVVFRTAPDLHCAVRGNKVLSGLSAKDDSAQKRKTFSAA